jgi:hypothetical protein
MGKEVIATYMKIENRSYSGLTFEPKHNYEGKFMFYVPPMPTLGQYGSFVIIDLEPIKGQINLDDWIFLWNRKKIMWNELEEKTNGTCCLYWG